jgi:hypothetical protein
MLMLDRSHFKRHSPLFVASLTPRIFWQKVLMLEVFTTTSMLMMVIRFWAKRYDMGRVRYSIIDGGRLNMVAA